MRRNGIAAVGLAALAALLVAPIGIVAVAGGRLSNMGAGSPAWTAHVPAEYVPLYMQSAVQCPELGLTAALLAAQGSVESGFDPNALSPAGAAGIAQFMPATWASWGRDGDGDGISSPYDPADAITAQGAFMCWLLEAARNAPFAGPQPGRRPVELALAGYHAGWGAAVQHGGIPPYVATQQYVREVMQLLTTWTTVASTTLPPPPASYTGGATGCVFPDPTGGRCLTGATAHAYGQVLLAFGDVWTAVGCQQERRAGGEHPLGRACDYAPGPIGSRPDPAQLATGWSLAHWLRAHADALDVRYIIWQGRIWSVSNLADAGGWGRSYRSALSGCDPNEITCGHFDHVHVSYRG